MPTYYVIITRTAYETRLFEVEADSPTEAEAKATADAYDHNWGPSDGSDYEVDSIDHDGTGVDAVNCSLCGNWTPADTAHLHRGKWVGDECCWDERLRSTE